MSMKQILEMEFKETIFTEAEKELQEYILSATLEAISTEQMSEHQRNILIGKIQGLKIAYDILHKTAEAMWQKDQADFDD